MMALQIIFMMNVYRVHLIPVLMIVIAMPVDVVVHLDGVNMLIANGVWKPHALLLTGDYFLSKKQHEKAKDFYMQILSLKDINKQQEFYDHAKTQFMLIGNE